MAKIHFTQLTLCPIMVWYGQALCHESMSSAASVMIKYLSRITRAALEISCVFPQECCSRFVGILFIMLRIRIQEGYMKYIK